MHVTECASLLVIMVQRKVVDFSLLVGITEFFVMLG